MDNSNIQIQNTNGQINIVGQDATGPGMNGSRGGNNNGVSQFSGDLQFENSPFYTVVHEIIKPTVLSKLSKYIL